MKAGSKLTTCAIVLSLGLTAAAALAAPRQLPPPAVNATRRQAPPPAVNANRRQPPPPTVAANRRQPPPAAVNVSRRQPTPSVVVAGLKSRPINTAELLRERLRVTTPGIKDPRTGQDLSKDLGSGLPGGKDLSKGFPSAEQQWNGRIKGALGGSPDYMNDGTPFDDKPGSNPLDGLLGKNIPDPLAGQGKGRSSFSPADDAPTQNDQGPGSVTVGQITMEDTHIICASDYVSPKDSGAKKDECVAIEYDRDGGFKTETDRKMAIDFFLKWMPKGSSDQQYEGEGGYTGGGGHSANDLNVGSTGRMTGKVPGGRDPGEAGLGKDAGGRMPARFEAIGKYVAQGGRVFGGQAGYQGGDSGHGQDIGGTAEKSVSGVKKATDAQRFIVDANPKNPEEVPWQLREKVSPTAQASK